MIRHSGRRNPVCDCCNGETTIWAGMTAERLNEQLLCEDCRDKKKSCCKKQERTMAIWRKVYDRLENSNKWYERAMTNFLFIEEEFKLEGAK